MEPHYLAGGTATTYSPVRTTSRSLLCFSSRSHKVTGPLTIGYTSDGLMVLRFGSAVSFSASFDRLADRMVEVSPDDPDGAVYWDQIMEYLEGHRKSFSLRLNLSLLATPFQRSVLAETLAIPFGHVRTYKEIAAAVDTPGASRAVGNALGNNPLAIVIPCHRVIASGNRLGGFMRNAVGGKEIKRRLLYHEGQAAFDAAWCQEVI